MACPCRRSRSENALGCPAAAFRTSDASLSGMCGCPPLTIVTWLLQADGRGFATWLPMGWGGPGRGRPDIRVVRKYGQWIIYPARHAHSIRRARLPDDGHQPGRGWPGNVARHAGGRGGGGPAVVDARRGGGQRDGGRGAPVLAE